MRYADFEYYRDTFCGRQIASEEEFDSLEIRARAYVDKITFGRAKAETEGVSNAVCACCEVIQSYSSHEGISSEDNDGYRVVYLQDTKLEEQRLYQTAMRYLPVCLLYRGLRL